MPDVKEMLDELEKYLKSADGLSIKAVTRGYPDFNKAFAVPPAGLVSLVYQGSTGNAVADGWPGRVGVSTKAIAIGMILYARDEDGLFNLADGLQKQRDKQPIELTVYSETGGGSDTVRLYVGEDEREEPEPGLPKERSHFTVAPAVLVYE